MVIKTESRKVEIKMMEWQDDFTGYGCDFLADIIDLSENEYSLEDGAYIMKDKELDSLIDWCETYAKNSREGIASEWTDEVKRDYHLFID